MLKINAKNFHYEYKRKSWKATTMLTIIGTIGQYVESLISIIPNRENVLIEIINEYHMEFNTLNAFIILAYYNSCFVTGKRQQYEIIFGEFASTVIDFIIEFHNYDLYI